MPRARRQHPGNGAFGQWLKDNGLGHLTHQTRAALLKIAKLDPEAASAAISDAEEASLIERCAGDQGLIILTAEGPAGASQ